MKILITGGAGFIGSNLTLRLLKNGHEVTILDNLSPQIHGEKPLESPLFIAIKDNVKFIHGSVNDKNIWKEAVNDNEVIVHLAAETGTGQSMYDIEKYSAVNIHGTSLMLDYLTNNTHSVIKIVVASSRAIYGEGKYNHPQFGAVYPTQRNEEDMLNKQFEPHLKDGLSLKLMATDENSKIHPTSFYGLTKQFQEQMIMTICPTLKIAPVAFRYQNVYGPGQSLSNPYTGILSIFSTQIRNGSNLNIFEDGLESRDFVYITDVVEATLLGIENTAADNKVFNVGTGIATNVLKVAETLKENYKSTIEIKISGQFRIGDIRHNFADLTKIKNTLGFEPKVDFEEGIKHFVKWVLAQEIVKNKYEQAMEEMTTKGLLK
jgi:dTDP-L-rhamnose 4-epimerase